MGRKTWESLPKRPLPERTNIVVTRNPGYRAEGAAVASTLDIALDIAWGEKPEEVMVIGGAELYRAALPLARRIYLTRVDAEPEGDTYFPPFDPQGWLTTIAAAHSASPERPIGYSFLILERK